MYKNNPAQLRRRDITFTVSTIIVKTSNSRHSIMNREDQSVSGLNADTGSRTYGMLF
jgi:hypothetical protein